MNYVIWKLFVLAAAIFALTNGSIHAQSKKSNVPAWDASGIGLLPRQGISCLDIAPSGETVAVGTIAPQGDSNVILLDAKSGKIVRQQRAGVRWINDMAVHGEAIVRVVCTSPEGKPGDQAELFSSQDGPVMRSEQFANRAGQFLFHYGDHSNHIGTSLAKSASQSVLAMGNELRWLSDDESRQSSIVRLDSHAISLAADGEFAVVGCVHWASEGKTRPNNLLVVRSGEQKPIWARPAMKETDPPPPMEAGVFGSPTPNHGDARPAEREQFVDRIWAPLSVAIHADPGDSGEIDPWRVAAADYQGWQMWVKSSATRRFQRQTPRFMPARPTINVYDSDGKLLRRFAPDSFKTAFWCDLHFVNGGKQLIAYPHNWTCRGLAGQSILPADDDANTVYLLDIKSGKVDSLELPDAIGDVAVSKEGRIAVGCWNGRAFVIDTTDVKNSKLPNGIEIGGASLVRFSSSGQNVIVADTRGSIALFDADGKSLWQTNLNEAVQPAAKAVVKTREEYPSIWLNSGRVQSDMGAQRIIEAPDGLILIDPNGGLSFEMQWQAIKNAGLDPKRVKFVLATHEHGDHAPGAYLWRVATGAKFICSEHMAYTLQHHIPNNTGYGFHPPVPTDIVIKDDTDLDLAGLKVRAVRIPGHTFGSMAWLFELGGKRYVATGDLIMPEGMLGYSGSVNFSARDVIHSLRKLQALKPDVVLPGHGGSGNPDRYLAAGIYAGRFTGWAKTPPIEPDPHFGLKPREDYMVVGWNQGATAADFGDINGDDLPDVVTVAPAGPDSKTALLRIFFSDNGHFDKEPTHVIPLPGLTRTGRVRIGELNGDHIPDFLVGGADEKPDLLPTGNQSVRSDPIGALVLSPGSGFKYRVNPLRGIREPQHWLIADLDGDSRRDALIGQAFGGAQLLRGAKIDTLKLERSPWTFKGMYLNLFLADINTDGRPDLVSSSGAVHLRRKDDSFPENADLQLTPPDAKTWTFGTTADFNADGKPDMVLGSFQNPKLSIYYNTGNGDRPFADRPNEHLDLVEAFLSDGQARNFNRTGPEVADANNDGIADLLICFAQDTRAVIMFGSKSGLSAKRSLVVPLTCRTHYQNRIDVADFDNDGKMDLALFGNTIGAGVGTSGGPTAVFIRRDITSSPR